MKMFVIVIALLLLLSCEDDKYNNLILKDENTNKRYLIKSGIGDKYLIKELKATIIGKDTLYLVPIIYD